MFRPGRRGLAVVLVYARNDEPTIADALHSALEQSAPPESYRILVVDDGSTDATCRIVSDYRGAGVELVQLPRSLGRATACNEVLPRIDTPCFIRLDGDGRFEPDLVEALLEARYMTGADLAFTDRFEEHLGGRREIRRLHQPPRLSELIGAGTLLPTDVVRDLGGYHDVLWDEVDLYTRLLRSGRCLTAHVPVPLYIRRVGAAGLNGRNVVWGRRQVHNLWPDDLLAQHCLYGFGTGAPSRAA